MRLNGILGNGANALLVGGMVWGFVDLLIRVTKEPKRKSRKSILSLLPFPFLPSGEPDEKASREPGDGRLVLQPVPVRNRKAGR